MSLPLDTLIKPVTEEEALEKALDILETIGLPSRSWRKGNVARSILRPLCRTFADFTTLMAAAIRGGFLDLAQGAWLTALAYYVFGVTRITAGFAQGYATFHNSSGLTYDSGNAGPGQVRIKNPATNKVYENTETLNVAGGGTATIAIRAVEVGSASSSASNTITAFETVLFGLSVTNPKAIIGSDDETDEELRQHCRNKLGALSLRGPRGAYEYAVREAKRDDGTPVDINRLSVSPASSKGIVTVHVASPGGAPDGDDLDAIRTSIERFARPDSVTAVVQAATEVAFTRSITIWAQRTDGVDAAQIEAAANAALVALIRNWRIGGRSKPPTQLQGYLYADAVAAAIKSSHSAIYDVDGVGSDMALAPGQVAVLATALTTRIVEEG